MDVQSGWLIAMVYSDGIVQIEGEMIGLSYGNKSRCPVANRTVKNNHTG